MKFFVLAAMLVFSQWSFAQEAIEGTSKITLPKEISWVNAPKVIQVQSCEGLKICVGLAGVGYDKGDYREQRVVQCRTNSVTCPNADVCEKQTEAQNGFTIIQTGPKIDPSHPGSNKKEFKRENRKF